MTSSPSRPTYHLARFAFTRLIALGFLLAFLSAWTQVGTLTGVHGLMPVKNMLDEAVRLLPEIWKRFWMFPTFCWVSSCDFSQQLQCALGAAASLGILFGFAPRVLLFASWALYLSLTVAGQDFFLYPWDNLLLEAGLLAAIVSPSLWFWRKPDPAREGAPGRLAVGLFFFLLVKILILSALAQLSSKDSPWSTLTVFSYLYETQPLPGLFSRLFHFLPLGIHKFLAAFVFFTELVLPFLLVLPARFRRWAFGPYIVLQMGLALSGHFGLLPFLTGSLGVWMLDDAAWPLSLRNRWLPPGEMNHDAKSTNTPLGSLYVYTFVTAVVGFGFLMGSFGLQPLKQMGVVVLRAVYPLRSFNDYALFSNVARERLEIIMEGTIDGKTWIEYPFRYKPGDPALRPRVLGPHMPRLDWQMAVAARGECETSPFLAQLAGRLLTNPASVSGLLGRSPFPDTPPQSIRFRVFRYHLSKKGPWWTREFVRDLCPEFKKP